MLPLSDVMAVQYVHSTDKSHCCPGLEVQNGSNIDDKPFGEHTSVTAPRHTSFILHYAAKGTKNTWRHDTVTLNHTDPRQVASWVKTIRNYLSGFKNRPKRLLIFVNPYGGKKIGLKIYEKQVKPLFLVAGIEVNAIITQRQFHARDTLLNCSFDNIDGVVCVGGDGTFSEVFNGLVLRTARDNGVDHNDPDVQLPPPLLRVGVIPGGSTDTMAYCFHGTTDIETAVLYVILGDSIGLDLCSIHSNGNLLRYYSSVISYGYLGDVVRDSEKFRWMGPKRYDYSGFKKFISNNGYEGEITLLADTCSPSRGPKCLENCVRCQSQTENKPDKTALSQGEWKTFRGKFFMVNGANVSCACSRSPNGISPYCHLGDGCVDVVIIKHTHMLNNLKLLLRLSSKVKNLFDLPFVEVHRAREFTFRALPASVSDTEFALPRLIPGTSVWNCDGEVQWETNIRIRVHCQLLKVFTRRSQETKEEPSCKICSF
ncbi:ceramide kinase isoform X2 [Zootermopsis nevadensis]|nr:ceramide kinase isoform X2 [Zootermopsis nevadensis]XP_021926265.1 ceramide kinase isoform X2 [Zootermopsis nevadensis]XP_021926266.1 ceramide kinase isoform X2 [Zootermopsis nevadensis]